MRLEGIVQKRRSLLCVALDPAEASSPAEAENQLLSLIKATAPYAVAYKLNTAFYERWGVEGWALLERIRAALPAETFAIADAKRGDIAYTNRFYAEAFFGRLDFDAVTVSPYLGWGALEPFLSWAGKGVFVLLRTTEAPPWQAAVWKAIVEGRPRSSAAQIGWVWGALQLEGLAEFREACPSDWLLMPGLGAQGGKLLEGQPLFPALAVVGRALSQAKDPAASAAQWAQKTRPFLPV